MMKKPSTLVMLMLSGLVTLAQPPCHTTSSEDGSTYRIISKCDYTFREMLDEGVTTASRQVEILNIPIRQFGFVVKAYIKRHNFALGRRGIRKTTFRSVVFTYPSVTPTGEPVMLSGLVVMPLLQGNEPSRVLLYHRIIASSYKIAPTNSLPIEAVLTADNTVCVFPDYYGIGMTEGEPLPFASFGYHARCATECLLTALEIVKAEGVSLSEDHYTWNTGYSQGAGYALATQKYIETVLPDSVSQRLNLRWSFCGGGVYSPAQLFEHAMVNNRLGSSPAIYLQSLRSFLHYNPAIPDTVSLSAFLSPNAIEAGIDSLMLSYDDGLWDLASRIEGLEGYRKADDLFCRDMTDTSGALYRMVSCSFRDDDCTTGWIPKAQVVLYHSEDDSVAPFLLALQVQESLSDSENSCILFPSGNGGSHSNASFKYFCQLLLFSEEKLYNRFCK